MKKMQVWKEEKERGIFNMEKGLLKFITCGSVDDGKSTLIGHILYDSKLLYADQKKALELDSKVGSREGEIDYSLLLDGLMAEREQGITIDVAYRYFTTNNRSFIVADTPGHEEYTRNMAVGASFADLSIILVDAKKGVSLQTKRHSRICKLMGIKHFVFAVNKMDLVNYSEERFNEISEEILEIQKENDLFDIYIIPVSATAGDNVTHKSENTHWYKNKDLLSYLEEKDISKSDVEEGFYMPVQRVCRPNHEFRGFQGQIEAGSISVGDEISVLPSNTKAVIKKIYIADKDSNTAYKNQPVTIQLDREVDISRGSVITKDNSISTAKDIISDILWMDDENLVVGGEYLFKSGTKLIPAVVTEILYKTDVNTGEEIKTLTLKKNELARCKISIQENIVLDVFENHREIGELILIDRISNMTSACGIIKKVIKDEKSASLFIKDDLVVRGDIFEEFYYNYESMSISKTSNNKSNFNILSELPLKGESYSYPKDFDIISLRDNNAAIIRNGIFKDLVSLSDYIYEGYPVVNARGFLIKVDSREKLYEFIKDSSKNTEFLNKYLDFNKYRRIVFHNNFWVI